MRDPSDSVVAALCVVGTTVSEELFASVSALEDALRDARRAHESAERRLRLQRDHVDDDLAAALAACRSLEEEKLAALGVRDGSDAEVFQDEPSAPAHTLTLHSLIEKHRTQIEKHRTQIERLREEHDLRIESLRGQHQAQSDARGSDFSAKLDAQRLELSKQYFAEVQDLATTSARSVETQAQQWRARDAERAAEVGGLQRDVAAGTASLAAVQQEISTRVAEDAALRHQIATLMADLHVTRTELSSAYTRIHLLLSSTSWRASRPLRGGGRLLRWITGR